ncbi:uncharacterized protein [Euphorbia lathyris]|uniref:uncharacterized protein n=1 Tax=Euphorbia lathyris TaxID=212925 RepID=UPI00331312F5
MIMLVSKLHWVIFHDHAREQARFGYFLISHYKSQGLDSELASVKVIEDLQNVLFRVISASNKNKKDRLVSETLKKVDVVNNRVGMIDLKVDSKPGYVETFVLGVASAAAFRGFENVWPNIAQIWSSVTKPPS